MNEPGNLASPSSHQKSAETAQPFYIHFGFEVVDHHTKEVRGVPIEYAAMRKVLSP